MKISRINKRKLIFVFSRQALCSELRLLGVRPSWKMLARLWVQRVESGLRILPWKGKVSTVRSPSGGKNLRPKVWGRQ